MRTALAAIILALILVACAQEQDTGRVVFGITDAAADMGTVTSVEVTIDSISLRGENDAWTTVSSEQQTFDLLQLKAEGTTAVLADVNISNGNYTEMRLEISKVVVVDDEGEHEAKLPSGELKFKGDITVEGNSTSTAVFDFIADESLHVTGNGKYILAPVVKVETREDAEVQSDGERMSIVRGNVRTDATVGMDLNGNVGVNVRVPADAAIEIDGDIVKIGGKANANALVNDTLNVTGKAGLKIE
jgi:hypothetical protein